MRAWLINEHILGATGIGNAKQRPLLRRFCLQNGRLPRQALDT
jgi:hypothetical protein